MKMFLIRAVNYLTVVIRMKCMVCMYAVVTGHLQKTRQEVPTASAMHPMQPPLPTKDEQCYLRFAFLTYLTQYHHQLPTYRYTAER